MKVEQVKKELESLFQDHSMADILISQLTDLWRVWEANKGAKSPQQYYQGLASLKTFNSILKRNTDAKELKKKLPRVATRNRHIEIDETAQFLPIG